MNQFEATIIALYVAICFWSSFWFMDRKSNARSHGSYRRKFSMLDVVLIIMGLPLIAFIFVAIKFVESIIFVASKLDQIKLFGAKNDADA